MENYTVKCEMNECRWEYLDNGRYKQFDDHTHMMIESGFQHAGTKTVEYRLSSYNKYELTFSTKTHKTKYGSKSRVRRVLLKSPEELRESRNAAIREAFFRNKSNKRQARALFRKYRAEPEEGDEDQFIEDDGLAAIGKALNIDIETDVRILVLSWLMDCGEMGVWTEDEFYLGLARLKCTTLSQLKQKASTLMNLIKKKEDYQAFYNWCFGYFKQPELKGLTNETAGYVWKLILKDICPLLPELIEFMEEYERGVSLDTWKMMLDFSRSVKRDLTGWNSVYPPFFDDFVEWLEEEKDIAPPEEE